MARGGRRGARAQDHDDFKGPDADRENLEKIAAAAAAENAKVGVGHNSGPSDESITRTANAIEAALIEIDNAGRIMQKARGELAAAQKTGKTDLGSKAWVEAVKAAVKLKRQAAKGGTGEIVQEHRQIGRILRLLDTPLGTQFNLFAVPEEEPAAPGEAKPVSEADAYLQGEHAYKNSEPRDNNPFGAGEANHVQWDRGWNDAFDANVKGTGGSPDDGGESPGVA